MKLGCVFNVCAADEHGDDGSFSEATMMRMIRRDTHMVV